MGVDVRVSRQKSYKTDAKQVGNLARYICQIMGLSDWDLAIQFVGSKKIRDLNKQYRGKDYPTDVLSFPQVDWPEALRFGTHVHDRRVPTPIGAPILGDLVLCLDVAKENADKIGQGLDREVCFLLVHGILHLCGHDHEKPDEERVMLEDQRLIMDRLSHDRPELWRGCVILSANI